MTESAFRDESSAQTEIFADEVEQDSRRNLVLFGALGAVVLAAGAFLFLGGGEESPDDLAAVPSARAPRVEAPVTPAEQVTLPPPADVPLGRNPFKALYVQPVAAPVVAKPPPPPPPPPPPAPAQVIVVTNGGPPTAVAPAPPAQSTVTFVSVKPGNPPVGTFAVDGKQFSQKKGDVFAGKLLLVNLVPHGDGWMAVLRVGESAPFEVYLKQQVVIP